MGSQSTRDHDEIRRWAESRGAVPVLAQAAAGQLRFEFEPRHRETLSPVSWDDFFRLFDEKGLELLYDDKPESRLHKLVYPEAVAAAEERQPLPPAARAPRRRPVDSTERAAKFRRQRRRPRVRTRPAAAAGAPLRPGASAWLAEKSPMVNPEATARRVDSRREQPCCQGGARTGAAGWNSLRPRLFFPAHPRMRGPMKRLGASWPRRSRLVCRPPPLPAALVRSGWLRYAFPLQAVVAGSSPSNGASQRIIPHPGRAGAHGHHDESGSHRGSSAHGRSHPEGERGHRRIHLRQHRGIIA